MYLLNNKNYFCQKNYPKKKTRGETRVNSFKCIFRKSEDIASTTKNTVNIRRPILGPFKSGRLGQMVTL